MFKHHKTINLENFSKINFLKLRECHNEIYAKEISYFLKNELSLDDISVELKNFFSYGKSISKFKYFSHLDFLNSQRKLSSFELKNSIIFSLSASDQAPKIGEPDKIDANLFWTSLGLPQLSLPLLKSESDNPIGLSLTGSKGSDINLLNLGKKLFPQYTDV
jgi:Asp-tRNA(Asn)/Glu-tRNA(Gln) amidotransferase A subunit family amidase